MFVIDKKGGIWYNKQRMLHSGKAVLPFIKKKDMFHEMSGSEKVKKKGCNIMKFKVRNEGLFSMSIFMLIITFVGIIAGEYFHDVKWLKHVLATISGLGIGQGLVRSSGFERNGDSK